jgi:hypothetical protein
VIRGGVGVTSKRSTIQVRVTVAQEREFQRLAAKSDMGLSEWIRAVLLVGSVMVRQPAISAEVAASSRPVVRVTEDGGTVEEAGPVRRSRVSRRVVSG